MQRKYTVKKTGGKFKLVRNVPITDNKGKVVSPEQVAQEALAARIKKEKYGTQK